MAESTPSHRKRECGSLQSRGLTLIELMVSITVIGLLFSILLPAIQSARESSRRVECVNHLKQIGLALQSYATLHGMFPGVVTHSGLSSTGTDSNHAYSPLARMLAELDQTPLYNAANLTDQATIAESLWANLTVMSTSMSIFLCPSDRVPLVPGYGRSNYRFSMGPSPWSSPGSTKQSSWDGPFTTHRTYRPASFADGLSNTVGVSERIQGSWLREDRVPQNYLLTGVGDIEPNTTDWVLSICRRAPDSLQVEARSGESWFLSGFHFTNYNHCATPNALMHDCSLNSYTEGIHWRTLHQGVFTARSRHRGGVNTCLMDGSVRWTSDGVSLAVWRALSTRAGGDLVSAQDW